jgi:hypothetical protein
MKGKQSISTRIYLSGHLAALAALIVALNTPALAQKAEATIDRPAFRFSLRTSGKCELLDKRTKVTWGAQPGESFLGAVTVTVDGKPRQAILGPCALEGNAGEVMATFKPVAELPDAAVRVHLATASEDTLRIRYEADEELNLQSISLLGDVLVVDDPGKGSLLVPVREGLLIPTDSGLSFTHRFDTYAYEGCHMQMLGLLQGGAAMLVTWTDPYVAVDVKSVATNSLPRGARQQITAALFLRKSARDLQLRFLGKGDQVTVAKAYRQVAKERGWLVTWDEKLKGHPERAKLFGAINYKLWSVLDRRMNLESNKEESSRVNWTFEEAALVAEHLKRDLKLDKVLFTIGGWIHRGYDNQHPDILPTAPECDGDAAFADCARRIMELGYLFCLHDNYQDIYRDSPSWDEKYIMKTADGQIAKGGHWAGGLAYLTCSKTALELAKRPQNLPAVKKLSNANSYFIDTTYAAGLQECFDPNHPLTRADDMKWKQELSDYARGVFGVFGSECGREWAIPHSDFFEGLTGVSGGYYHDAKLIPKLGATVVPLFELVYRDCIAMYGKYGYDPKRSASYVLHHISIGRPLNYHNIPHHLYWKEPRPEQEPDPGEPGAFTPGKNGWAVGLHPTDRFVKNTYEILSPLNELTARMPMTSHQFLTPDRKVQKTVFGEGRSATTVIVNGGTADFPAKSEHGGGNVLLPPYGFLIDSPGFVAFHALSWNKLRYEPPALFTLRALDGRSLSSSKQLRVYHAFGNENIRLPNKNATVIGEAVFE